MAAVPEGLVILETQELSLRIGGCVLWVRMPYCWTLVI